MLRGGPPPPAPQLPPPARAAPPAALRLPPSPRLITIVVGCVSRCMSRNVCRWVCSSEVPNEAGVGAVRTQIKRCTLQTGWDRAWFGRDGLEPTWFHGEASNSEGAILPANWHTTLACRHLSQLAQAIIGSLQVRCSACCTRIQNLLSSIRKEVWRCSRCDTGRAEAPCVQRFLPGYVNTSCTGRPHVYRESLGSGLRVALTRTIPRGICRSPGCIRRDRRTGSRT